MELSNFELFFLAIGAMGLGTMLLVRGGDWTIDAAVYIARKIGVSPLVVGFTVVAFGTSLPELIVSVNANLNGSAGIAIGNVLGSNIANILLVIGASAAVTTLITDPKSVLRDILAMILATILIMAMMLTGAITPVAGAIMIALLVAYVVWQYRNAKLGNIETEDLEEPEFAKDVHAYLFLLGGLVFVALGAEFLVRGAQVSAGILGVPEAVIALSLIAIGTSLPELSTCIAAAMKKQSDIIIGNIIGSNFFNIMMILGTASVIKTIDVTQAGPEVITRDIWVMLGVTLFFSLTLLLRGKIGRVSGVLYLVAYAVYMVAIFLMSQEAHLPL